MSNKVTSALLDSSILPIYSEYGRILTHNFKRLFGDIMTLLGKVFGNDESNESVDTSNAREALVESGQRFKGKITKLHDNGWGFITSHEIKFTRIFFHWTGLKQTTLNFTQLKEGMEVEFNTVDVPDKGKRATKIIVTNTDSPKKSE